MNEEKIVDNKKRELAESDMMHVSAGVVEFLKNDNYTNPEIQSWIDGYVLPNKSYTSINE